MSRSGRPISRDGDPTLTDPAIDPAHLGRSARRARTPGPAPGTAPGGAKHFATRPGGRRTVQPNRVGTISLHASPATASRLPATAAVSGIAAPQFAPMAQNGCDLAEVSVILP